MESPTTRVYPPSTRANVRIIFTFEYRYSRKCKNNSIQSTRISRFNTPCKRRTRLDRRPPTIDGRLHQRPYRIPRISINSLFPPSQAHCSWLVKRNKSPISPCLSDVPCKRPEATGNRQCSGINHVRSSRKRLWTYSNKRLYHRYGRTIP